MKSANPVLFWLIKKKKNQYQLKDDKIMLNK